MKPAGQVLGGIAGYQSGKYTRKVMFGNAQAREAQGVGERERIRLAARLTEGRQLTDQADSGFQLGTGSAIDALRETATARELDILTSRFNADSAARGYRQQGNLAYAQGKAQLVGGIISGAATLMEEVASAGFGGAGGAPSGMAAAHEADAGYGL